MIPKIYLTEQQSNTVKFLLTSVILSSLTFVVVPSVEKLRRAYLLQVRQKVCIGTAKTSPLRKMGISVPARVLLLYFLFSLLMIVAELSVEITSASDHDFKGFSVVKMLTQRLTHKSEEWLNQSLVIANGLNQCAMFDNNTMYTWESVFVENETEKMLFCPRNLTAFHFRSTREKAHSVHLSDLDEQSEFLAKTFNGTLVTSKTIPEVRKVRLRVFALGRIHDVHNVTYLEHSRGVVSVWPSKEQHGNGTREMLECLVVRFWEMTGQDVVGCVGLTSSGDRMVFYINDEIQGTEPIEWGNQLTVRPIGISPILSREGRRFVIEQGLFNVPETYADLLNFHLYTMIGNSSYTAGPREFIVWDPGNEFKPSLNIWALCIALVTTACLLLSSCLMQFRAWVMLPYFELVGEDNILRVWSREVNETLPKREICWLVVSCRDDSQSVMTFDREPRSSNCNLSIVFEGVCPDLTKIERTLPICNITIPDLVYFPTKCEQNEDHEEVFSRI